jgi:hypothetical protein
VWRAAEQVRAEYNLTMRPSRPALIAMAVLVCLPIALGEGLKPDRVVSVTSILLLYQFRQVAGSLGRFSLVISRKA